MAQKDIQDIADYMKQIDESKAAEEDACSEACKECEQQQALEDEELEDEELEDEVIDKESLGFIDDASIQDESDAFYAEDEEASTLDEDVSDCIEQKIEEEEQQATIEVEVFNEDDFGKYFAQKVEKRVPGVKATVKKTLPNGDLLVQMHGTKEALQQAFAFYLGYASYSKLDQDAILDFESRLVFDDGDTLAEADYREAVAHCLDDVGVNASTANLADQDTCAISLIKEEKAKRLAKKALKCLQEDDFSSLSDDELDVLDKIKDTIDNDQPLDQMSAQESKVWQLILADMGYTQDQWNSMTPEQRENAWKKSASNQPAGSRTGFGDGVHVGTDPKTGKLYRYRNQYEVTNPATGDKETTMFNPNYDADNSIYQHPTIVKKQMKKDAAAADAASKEKLAVDAMKKVRGRKGTWTTYEFAQMLAALDGKQRKQLMNDLIDSIEKDHADDPRKAGEEIMLVKQMFGKKLTLRDFAKAWGKSPAGVMKFADETISIWQRTLRQLGIKSRAELLNSPTKFELFTQQLKKNLAARRKGSIVKGD